MGFIAYHTNLVIRPTIAFVRKRSSRKMIQVVFFFLVYRDAYHNFVLKLEHSNFISACICPGCNDAGTCQFVVMNTRDLLMSGERADVFLHSTSFSNFLLLFSFLLYARMDVGQCGNVSPILGRKTKMIDRLCAAYGFPVTKK